MRKAVSAVNLKVKVSLGLQVMNVSQSNWPAMCEGGIQKDESL